MEEASVERETIENTVDSNTEEEEQPIKKIMPQFESSKEEKPLIICVKSYGDYRFIEAKDIAICRQTTIQPTFICLMAK